MTVTIGESQPGTVTGVSADDTSRAGAAIPTRAQVLIGVVACGAAVLSFSALRGLAVSTGTWSWIAFLLPVSLDAAAGVAMFVWMRAEVPHVVRYAKRLTWASILVSIVCNGAHHGFAATGLIPPWYAAVAVGAIPPIMFGAVAHLAFLSRQPERWGGPESVTLTSQSEGREAQDDEPAADLAGDASRDDPSTVALPVAPAREPSHVAAVKLPHRRCDNPGCGKLLPPGSRADRKFCDGTCRQAASRARNAVTDSRTSEVPA